MSLTDVGLPEYTGEAAESAAASEPGSDTAGSVPEQAAAEEAAATEAGSAAASAAALEVVAEQDPAPMFTEAEVYEIARVTYLETGSQGEAYYYVTYLTACVIINRYLDWGYSSIADVIHAPGQYATADKYDDWGGGELAINDVTWRAVYDAIENTDRNPHYQACSYSLEKYGLTMYYDDGRTQIYY